jgi:hypothetical protein
MSPAIVLTAAAVVLVTALTKSTRRNRARLTMQKAHGGRDSFEVLADNLKAAAKKVDNSAARVRCNR